MNNNYKEIVTKAVIGKSKKTSKDEYSILVEEDISNVLGCWVIVFGRCMHCCIGVALRQTEYGFAHPQR